MPPNICFLTMSQVKRLHATIISPNTVPTQPNLLESAVHSPMNLNHYTGQEDIFQLAANLSEKIMRNHAYQDGNKRTALVAADMFLKINGHHLQGGLHVENGGLAEAQVALVTGDFTNYDVKGVPTTAKVPIIVGEPGQTYVLVPTDIGRAFHTASLELNEPTTGLSTGATDETCKATFFHDSQHFGVGGPSKYPQLRIPTSLPPQTDSNTSPATIYLNGKMHNMVLDGTADAGFAQMANDTVRTLRDDLERLKDM
ncbi:Fido domain-containing protein [Trichophyton interdigitale]|uniref:Fido domain-containing protein n=1 Tax=Trichophyton interdigitale TaxID=101480 RepID=A0A9P5D271_9EURO|nr:Fido domain-containing protein [Trichophyton interdigitale]